MLLLKFSSRCFRVPLLRPLDDGIPLILLQLYQGRRLLHSVAGAPRKTKKEKHSRSPNLSELNCISRNRPKPPQIPPYALIPQ